MNIRKPIKQALANIERKGKALGQRIENSVLSFNDNHNQIIKRTFAKIDRLTQPDYSRGGSTPMDDKLGKTIDNIGDAIGRAVMSLVARGDEMRHNCPRCKNEWTRYQPNRWCHCDRCNLAYQPLTGKVICYLEQTTITWDIDKHTTRITDKYVPPGLRTNVMGNAKGRKIAWLPFDFLPGDLQKYLVLL